ncbi:MAG: DMT family transporter [Pseudomonadota bacterium]|nr:DMT family transporter [Pseudomonadota bacterium]
MSGFDSLSPSSRGILWMLGTMLCFVALDSMMKLSLETYSVLEVSWARFFFSTVFALFLTGRQMPQLIIAKQPTLQLSRSFMLCVTTAVFNIGIAVVPLPTGTTIMMLTPLLVTLFSALFLGEHVGWRRFSGIGLGLVGAMIVMRVWELAQGHINQGYILLFSAAITNAIYQTTTRSLRGEDPRTTLIYSALVGAVATSFILPLSWVWPTWQGWLLFLGSGLAAGLGHLCLIRAYTAAPASVIAPFYYSSIIWSALAGYVIWQDLPALTTLIGAALIIGSGLYIIWRERKLGLIEPA